MSTREQERAELYRVIWGIANDLRGSVDGWDFKQYVLGLLFYRYISENITSYINKNEREVGDKDFDYSKISDKAAEEARKDMVSSKGFFILPSELFENIRKNSCDENATFIDSEGVEKNLKDNLNEKLELVFKHIEESAKGSDSEKDFSGLFADLDCNSPKLGNTVKQRNEKLVKLLDSIGSMNLGIGKDSKIDAFGDAYEFLMTMYASNAGKSGGEFFTPQEVSRLLTLIALDGRKRINKAYDPAVGSGSLLLQAAKILGKNGVKTGFYGQEINLTTYNLCRINMFLHDINYEKFNIALGDTLTEPQHWDEEPFDLIVSNPPYSIKWAGKSNPILINDERFSPAGVLAPESKADLAFIMHSLSWLSPEGTAAIVCFPGIFYRSGAEQKIRKYLVDNNFVDAVIQMPSNLFFGTSIATCLFILKKNRKDNKVAFIDASEIYTKATNNNKLSEENIQTILKYYTDKKKVKYKVSIINQSKIAEENYNLSVSTYVEQEDKREKIDIIVLNKQIEEIVKRENELRKSIDKIIKEIEG